MAKESSDTYQIIWLIRRLFRALGQESNESLQHLGISAADRAVLEFLYPQEQLSVPDIAARYQVSRQHIQVTVNSLVDSKLLKTKGNPRHKRSPLNVLTAKGRKLFSTIKKRDDVIIQALFSGVSTGDIHTTQQTLQTLLSRLR